MKVEMSSRGALIISPESNLERHALAVWQASGAMVIVKTGSRPHAGQPDAQNSGSTYNGDYEPEQWQFKL